jgi:DNA-binding transcriptional regulator YiaG
MKNLTDRIRKYGIRKLARRLGTQPSTVKRWADANRAPTWRMDQLREALRK